MNPEKFYDALSNEVSGIILSANIADFITELNEVQTNFFFSQYYYLVERFPRYLGALLWQCHDEKIRFALSDNLVDECGGIEKITNKDYSATHPTIYKIFLNELGIRSDELNENNMNIHTKMMINTFDKLFLNSSFIEAMGGMAPGTESTSPQWVNAMYLGLKRQNRFSKEGLYYFDLHVTADEVHGNTLKEALVPYLGSQENQALLKSGAMTAALALKNFFNAMSEEINHRYTTKKQVDQWQEQKINYKNGHKGSLENQTVMSV